MERSSVCPVYPGTFCPPTYGHLDIVKRAAEVFAAVTVVCSENPEKNNNLFSPEECKRLWNYYRLPLNVKVMTFDEFKKKEVAPEKIVMVRGIRNEADFEYEKKVAFFNEKNYQIDKFFYLLSRAEYKDVSSSKVRAAIEKKTATDFSRLVHPLVLSALLEKVFGLKRLYVAVGRPASGKSTILKTAALVGKNSVHVDTDEFNHRLKPVIEKLFPGKNLIEMAVTREDDLKKAIKNPWFKMVFAALEKCPKESVVFLEVPYGLQKGKDIFRYLGGRILYFGCRTKDNYRRNKERNTEERAAFIKKIPGLGASRKIARRNGLNLFEINTSGRVADNVEKIMDFLKKEA